MNQDISILFEDLKYVKTPPPMDGCMVLWVGWWMGLSFDILIFDCLLKAPQPVTGLFFIPNSLQIQTNSQSLLIHSYPSLACYLFNKLFNSIACLLYFINLQLVIPGRTWILLYLGRTVYKRLWACLALY